MILLYNNLLFPTIIIYLAVEHARFCQLRVSFLRQASVQCVRVQLVIELLAANERPFSIYKFLPRDIHKLYCTK
jgi:hypothetical protein